MKKVDKIFIYADGGCRGNQFKTNVGGYGVVIMYGDAIEEFYGAQKNTTNNIMELTSAIRGLEEVKYTHIPIEVVMDSQYVVKGINERSDHWLGNGWKTVNGDDVKNKELWERLIELKEQFKDITFTHCKGHSDCYGNNMADQLANFAMDERR